MPNNNEATSIRDHGRRVDTTTATTFAYEPVTISNSGNGFVGQPFSVTGTLNNWRAMEEALQQEVSQDRELPIDVMKQRHLDGNERMIFHKPKKDWIVTKNGTEICRSSTVLDVSDLVAGLV